MIPDRIPTREEIIARRNRLGLETPKTPVVPVTMVRAKEIEPPAPVNDVKPQRVWPRDYLYIATPRMAVVDPESIVPHYFVTDIIDMAVIVSGVENNDLLSARRTHPIPKARQLVSWAARRFTTASTILVGKRCGGRDHSTVVHGYRVVGTYIKKYGIDVSSKNPQEVMEKIWPYLSEPRYHISGLWHSKWPRIGT